jgi:serine/threonine-protein kinase
LNRFGRLPVGDAVHIILDIAKALEHAHSRNVVHRDIKPDNILITRSGVAKLADLGLAKRTDEASHLTAARQGFGTPYYMPYEQAMNAKYADGRSDIYALGATLYHLLAGEVPFPGVNHLEILDKKNNGYFVPASLISPEVPAVLDDILGKMLGREPAERYQTASELIVDLERANLAASVPSFVDPELALRDPLVRQRLTSAAQPTSPDLRQQREAVRPPPRGNPDLWYLRYRDRNGQWCKARATTAEILQRLRDGKLPRDAEASREAQGGYKALASYGEFQAADGHGSGKRPAASASSRKGKRERPAPASSPPQALAFSRRWWVLLGAGVGLVALSCLVIYKLLANVG